MRVVKVGVGAPQRERIDEQQPLVVSPSLSRGTSPHLLDDPGLATGCHGDDGHQNTPAQNDSTYQVVASSGVFVGAGKAKLMAAR